MGWVYVRRCAYKYFSFVLCCEELLGHVSLRQHGEVQRIEVQRRVPDKREIFLSSSLSIPFTVPNTFTPCDSGPCS